MQRDAAQLDAVLPHAAAYNAAVPTLRFMHIYFADRALGRGTAL